MKKKNITYALYIVMTAVAFLFVQSCTKEKVGDPKIYANIQQYVSGTGSKVHIEQIGNNKYSCWDVGDDIKCGTSVGTIGYEQESGKYYISYYGGNINSWSSGAMGFAYPASYFVSWADPYSESGNDVFFEPTQKYEEVYVNGPQRIKALMAGYLPPYGGQSGQHQDQHIDYDEDDPNTPTVDFYNVTALLEVNVTGNCTITRIEVENTGVGTGTSHTGRPLWGDFHLHFVDQHLSEDETIKMPVVEEKAWTTDPAAKWITKEVTLECEEHADGGVVVNGSHLFYIVLPPVDFDKVRITVYAKDPSGTEHYHIEQGTRSGTFLANHIYKFSVTYDANWPTLSRQHDLGPYTIYTYEEVENEQTVTKRKQVEFDFANIHHDRTGYFIPPYQYDFVGFHDPNDDYDVFACTKTTNDQTYTITTTDKASSSPSTLLSYNPANTPPFQGPAGITPANGWYLLSFAEWDYILNTRPDSYRFFSVIVASVPGVLLIPDNDVFTGTNVSAAYSAAWSIITGNTKLHSPNTLNNTFTSNILNMADFYVLENAGCVFLPCVEYGRDAVEATNDRGYFWVIDDDANGMCAIKLDLTNWTSNILYLKVTQPGHGNIRLVRDYVAATSSKK